MSTTETQQQDQPVYVASGNQHQLAPTQKSEYSK
jgi:hypothetical protein